MKKILLYTALLFLISRCDNKDHPVLTIDLTIKPSVSIFAVLDFTDRKLLWANPDPILELYQCEKYPETECRFRLTTITDKRINPAYSHHLPTEAETDRENKYDDPQFRNRAIVGFYNAVRSSFADLYRQFDTTKSCAYSECWATVCAELQQLSAERSEQKYLILYGDLLEKSALFDAYGQASAMDVQTIAKKFENAGSLPESLQGITLICVYQPPTREDDVKFNTMISAYKSLLEKRGAGFVVQANNKEFSL